jgi:hypothetical protein
MIRAGMVRAAIVAAVVLGGPWGAASNDDDPGSARIAHASEAHGEVRGSVVGGEAGVVRQPTPGPKPRPSGIEIAPNPNVKAPRPGAPAPMVDLDGLLLPEHLQPGTHTLTLEVGQTKPVGSIRGFHGGTSCHPPDGAPMLGHVGWGQVEWGEAPCFALVVQLAVQFDKGPLADVPVQVYDRAVLTYDEREGFFCGLVEDGGTRCWTNGQGDGTNKPDGCGVVRIPTLDWASTPHSGLIPFKTEPVPAVRRLSAREWDVTEAYNWQSSPGAAPLGANPGFGFLLTGVFTSLDQLEAEDNEMCVSAITNIRLLVNYTIPPAN